MARLGEGSRWRVARYVGGACFAAVATYLSVTGIDWPRFLVSFQTASIPWVLAAILSVLLTISFVTARWALLLDTPLSVRSWCRLWEGVVVGQAVNILFPLRFGEGARLAYACRELRLTSGRVLVSLAVERVFDVISFLTATVIVGTAIGLAPAMAAVVPRSAIAAAATIAAVAVSIALLVVAVRYVASGVGAETMIGRWIAAQQIGLRQGLTAAAHPGRIAGAVVLTACCTIGAASTNFMVFRAFGLALPAVAALTLLVVLQLGTSVVSVPGNVGVFHYLTVVTLTALGVPPPAALAVGVVLHAVGLGPKIILAGVALGVAPWRHPLTSEPGIS